MDSQRMSQSVATSEQERKQVPPLDREAHPVSSAVMNVVMNTPSALIRPTSLPQDVLHPPFLLTVAVQTALTLAIFTGTAFTLGTLAKLLLYLTKTQISIHPQTLSLSAAAINSPIVLSSPKSLWDVFDYRDPAHWVFGLTTLGFVGFTQMILVGGMVINLGDIFGLQRIRGNRQGE